LIGGSSLHRPIGGLTPVRTTSAILSYGMDRVTLVQRTFKSGSKNAFVRRMIVRKIAGAFNTMLNLMTP
jgi:hypothetical protein